MTESYREFEKLHRCLEDKEETLLFQMRNTDEANLRHQQENGNI